MAKMDWYIEDYLKGKRPFEISATGKHFGTLCEPTGAGKSAIIFDDMLKKIENNKNKRMIINLVSPILKLKKQTIQDFISIISDSKIRKYFKNKFKIDLQKISFYNNSSDDTEYGDEYDAMSLDKEKMINDRNKIFIVDNCLNSFPKMIDILSDKKYEDFYVVTYIDESHKVTLNKLAGNSDEIEEEYLDIDSLIKYSNAIYSISATPHDNLTEKLNYAEDPNFVVDSLLDNNKFILYKSPYECMKEGIIVKPSFHIIDQTNGNDGAIDVASCENAMSDAKNSLPNIFHKILINCRDIKQIDDLEAALLNKGYKVFKTHSKNSDEQITDKVDNYEGDCFVLHCRQLIAGIDINSLTDCIIPTFGWDSFYKEIVIQTIGRCMRSLKGERGEKEFSRRQKPFCNVYFVTNKEDHDTAYELAYLLLARYYRAGFIEFTDVEALNNSRGNLEEFEMEKNHKTIVKGYFDTLQKLVETPQGEAYNLYRYMKRMGRLGSRFVINNLLNILNTATENIKKDPLSKKIAGENFMADKDMLVANLINSCPENVNPVEWNDMKEFLERYA